LTSRTPYIQVIKFKNTEVRVLIESEKLPLIILEDIVIFLKLTVEEAKVICKHSISLKDIKEFDKLEIKYTI